MSKRRTESTSSSSTQSEEYDTDCSSSAQSSIDDPSFTLGSCGQTKRKKSQKAPLAKGRKSSVDLKQKEQTPVASMSAQLQSGLGNTVKREIEEMEVEHNGLTNSAQQRMGVDCSSSAVGEKGQVRRLKRQRVSANVIGSKDPKQQSQQPPSKQPSKKVGVSKPHKKYFEGCLVMAWGTPYRNGNPYWPGIIRRAGSHHRKHHNYYRNSNGRIWFCIQFFTNPTIVGWRLPVNIRLFNAAKPNRCNFRIPDVAALFEEGIRIAKAASKLTVEDRLAKFTLPDEASTASLLKRMEEWKAPAAPSVDGSVAQMENNPTTPTLGNGRIFADSVIQEEGESTQLTNTNDESCSEPVAQNEIPPAPLANGIGESCPDSVDIMKKRISEYQKKLRDECNREKDEEIKRLTTDKEMLAATVKEQANMIEEFQKQREKENQEKLRYREELEKMKAVFEEMFGGCGAK